MISSNQQQGTIENALPKRPFVYYGVVDAFEKKYDSNNPNRFDVVLKVSLTDWNQEGYTDQDRKVDQSSLTVVLQGDWSSTVIQVKDVVNIIILTPSSDPNTVFISSSTDNSNFLIIHPDRLLTATNLAVSFNCLRRAVLSGYVNTYQENKFSIFGRLRHDLIEVRITYNSAAAAAAADDDDDDDDEMVGE